MKKSIFLFFAAILCATSAWGIGFNKGNVIFRAQGWNSPAHVYLCVGHDNYTQVWEMGKIPNTDLYHVWVNVDNNENNWWNGCTYFAVIGSSNTVSNGFKKSELSSKGNKGYTAAYTNAYDINNYDGIYFFNKNNNDVKGGSFSIDWCGSHSDIVQLEAKQAAKVRNSKADAYTDINDTWPATLALKGTYLDGNTVSGSSEITGTKSSDGNTYNTVVTGKVTHTYDNLSEDYHFEGWGTADAPISVDASYEYNITENTTVYAFFTKKYPVNFSADANGSVTATADEQALTSGDKVVGGTEVTLTATANDGYKFVNWTKGGEQVSTEATYSLTVTEDVELVANFELKTYTVEFLNYDGEVLQSSTVNHGETPVYSGKIPERPADAQYTYTFSGWDNAIAAATGDQTYKAQFNTTVNQYTITVNTENGTVTGAGTYNYKETATLTATADEGYHFEKWSNCSTDNPLNIVVTEDIELQAIFAINTYTITATATGGGTVNGAETYDHGTSVTLTATPDFDYQFVNWTVGGEVVSTDNPYTFPATANVEVVANFQEVAATTQTISGKFSTGKYEYAEFATGNLQYKKDGEDETWRFAKQQYQVVGEQNINVGDPNYKGWIDMFGWSNGEANNFGVNPSFNKDDYNGKFENWGTKMGEGWLTLTDAQWNYLLYQRANASKLKQIAMVGETRGIMLFPDDWTKTTVDATDDAELGVKVYKYDLTQWTALESAGAVFLPAAGRRFGGYGNTVQVTSDGKTALQYGTNYFAAYWTSTKHNDGEKVSYLLNLGNKGAKYSTLELGWYEYGYVGQSVRLAKVTNTLIQLESGDNSEVIEANADKKVNVQVNRTFKANDGYYTICLPFDLDDASKIGKAYQVTSITEHVAEEGFFMVFNEVETIKAGQPYLILPKNLTNPIFENVTIVNTTGETVTATGAGINFEMVGVINGGGQTELGQYWVGDNGCFYNGDGTQTTDKLGLRVLFNITNTEGQRVNVRARVVVGENTTTGLDNITNGENTTIKVIENGQLVIIRNGEKFNAQGMRL